jgi:hypothetical protein
MHIIEKLTTEFTHHNNTHMTSLKKAHDNVYKLITTMETMNHAKNAVENIVTNS